MPYLRTGAEQPFRLSQLSRIRLHAAASSDQTSSTDQASGTFRRRQICGHSFNALGKEVCIRQLFGHEANQNTDRRGTRPHQGGDLLGYDGLSLGVELADDVAGKRDHGASALAHRRQAHGFWNVFTAVHAPEELVSGEAFTGGHVNHSDQLVPPESAQRHVQCASVKPVERVNRHDFVHDPVYTVSIGVTVPNSKSTVHDCLSGYGVNRRASHNSIYWPFGALTPQQQRAHQAQLDAMRAGLLAKLPEALL